MKIRVGIAGFGVVGKRRRDCIVRHPDHRGQLTEHVLADSLARIFERFGGQATRRFDAYGGFEYGPYRDFVAAVLLIVPDFLKRSPGKRKRQRDPVDYMVRISAKKANRTPKKPSVYADSEGDLFSIISTLSKFPDSPPRRKKS